MSLCVAETRRFDIMSQTDMSTIHGSRRMNFLICRVCFWCASYLYGPYRAAERCPMCDNNSIESIPISDKEAFEFGYSQLRGVTLYFFPIHKKPSDV
jgi:hypothetical protein